MKLVRASLALPLIALLSLAAPAAAVDSWEPIVKDRERQVEIDRSTVIQSDNGAKVAWARIVLSPERAETEGYAAVKALNRFDCYNRSFFTVKRVYLDSRHLVLREESVLDQSPVLAARNSVDERLWQEVCRPPSVADLHKVAQQAAASAAAVAEQPKPEARPVSVSRAAAPSDATLPANISRDAGRGREVDLEPPRFDYRPTRFRITDTGRTLKVDVGAGMGVEIRGQRYELEHLQFHRPSVERVGGQASAMTVHFHHRAADGRIAIVAVLLERGEMPHPLVQTLWNSLPLERGGHYEPASATIDPATLIPADPSHYLYLGSLVTPPCTEGVTWVVMKSALTLSDDQLAIFARLYPRNGRPLQPRNGRIVLESR